MRNNITNTMVFITLLVILTASRLHAHNNDIVHPGLTNAAAEVADIPEISAKCNFDVATDTQCSFIDEGSVKEDMGLISSYLSWDTDKWGINACGLLGGNWTYHAYNPITGGGWMDSSTIDAVNYVVPIWNQAIYEYKYGNQNTGTFMLGRVAHLLEDMTSPAHVHGDIHTAGDDFESYGANYFENFVFSSMGLAPEIPSGDILLPSGATVAGDSIKGIFQNLAKATYDFTSYQGHLQEIAGIQPDSELSRMFPTLHYIDGGILGDNYWEIDNVGGFEQNASDEWWACAGDHSEYDDIDGFRNIEGNFYIENSAGDDGLLKPAVFEKAGAVISNPNNSLLDIYAENLFPKTVSCVAGLFTVFTDADTYIEPTEPTEVSGTISSDTTWTLANSPYHTVGDVTVTSGATLTIEAGVIVKLGRTDYNYNHRLFVDGTLNLLGTSGNEVIFTSTRDDVYGGDSNGDGSSTLPSNHDWGYIKINNASSTIHHAIFRYGGYRSGGTYMLWVNDCSPIISNCTFEYAYDRALYYYAEQSYTSNPQITNNVFRDSKYGLYFDRGSTPIESPSQIEGNYVNYNTTAGIYLYRTSGGTVLSYNTIRNNSYGIRCNSAYVNINENNIYDNTSWGVYNDTSSRTINAKRNWWGNASGPTHASNPGGIGDNVSNYVDFSSWQTESVSSGGTGMPTISSTPLTYGIVGYRYNYDVDNIAQATGSRPLTWSVVYGPAGFQIDSSTGLITWYPDEPSSHSVVLMVENSYGSDIQAFNIYVSLDDGGGPGETQETQVPELTGLTLSAAQQSLSVAVLSQGSVSYVNSEIVPINCVIRQTPSANAVVNENYPIDLLVSKGIRGSLDNDNSINMTDFAKLANYWGEPAVLFPDGDLDDDGFIGIGDLLIICEGWLTSGPVKLYEVVDGDPGWTMTGQWQFGTPLGLGGVENGNPDPEAGYTGNNVYGVNIYGDYSTEPGGPYRLKAGPFNCSEYNSISLKFARWLNIDEPFYASAKVEVRNEASDWQAIWVHDGNGPITDNEWQDINYDISQYAGGYNEVYIRWCYEIFDWAYPYSGWNIDDVELLGTK